MDRFFIFYPLSIRKMEEKTEQLRDIFLSVSDEETVTESQTAGRGSLTDDKSVEERLADELAKLREKFGFETSLSGDERQMVIERFYEGDSDEQLADALECDTETVFRARMELHLVRDEEPPLDGSEVETLQANPDADTAELAAMLETDEEAIKRTRAILEATDKSRRVSQRFTTAFQEILTDTELTDQFASDAHDDGLDDATEGAETDVDL